MDKIFSDAKEAKQAENESSKFLMPLPETHLLTPGIYGTHQETQCEESRLFEVIDYRKCLRCGLNDKEGQCRFHPAYPETAGGAGKMLYGTEWHACRETCSNSAGAGCHINEDHYYGTHLACVKSLVRGGKRGVNNGEKDTGCMTDVSMLYNPFK